MESPQSSEELVSLLYEDLRSIAASCMRGEGSAHTLQPTAIVHEAYLRLQGKAVDVQSEAHFRALAALQMRRVLVDHARTRDRVKRGGSHQRIPWDVNLKVGESIALEQTLDLSDQLDSLADLDARAARVVELRFFGGLQHSEIAEILSVSVRTVEDDWRYARAWLYQKLEQGSDGA